MGWILIVSVPVADARGAVEPLPNSVQRGRGQSGPASGAERSPQFRGAETESGKCPRAPLCQQSHV